METLVSAQTQHQRLLFTCSDFRGCVTPKQIVGVKSSIEDDLDLFDGFDELPDDFQEKVKTALANGHIADDDWTGVPSVPPALSPLH